MSSRDAVTRSDPSRVRRQLEFTRSDLQKRVGEKQTDSLRLLIVVGGHGAFVAAFRDLPQIILAHLYPQFAEPAALALAQRAFAQPTSPCSVPPWRA
jgi:hypothetical protein